MMMTMMMIVMMMVMVIEDGDSGDACTKNLVSDFLETP